MIDVLESLVLCNGRLVCILLVRLLLLLCDFTLEFGRVDDVVGRLRDSVLGSIGELDDFIEEPRIVVVIVELIPVTSRTDDACAAEAINLPQMRLVPGGCFCCLLLFLFLLGLFGCSGLCGCREVRVGKAWRLVG